MPYGTWIKPSGRVIEVDYEEHSTHCDHDTAREKGWIRTMEHREDEFCASYNEVTVRKKALRVLHDRFKNHGGSVLRIDSMKSWHTLCGTDERGKGLRWLNKAIADAKPNYKRKRKSK